MDTKFDAIEYLSGLTGFVFDKSVLKRIAIRRGIADVHDYEDVDSDLERLCTKDLLLTVIRGPWSTASSTHKHGTFEVIIGQQTITASALEGIKNQIRYLNRQLGLDENDGLPYESTNTWVNDSWDA